MKNTVLLLCVLFFFSCSKEKRSDKKGLKMQEFVSAISNYARQQNPNFIVIPQNGVELAFNNLDITEGFNQDYLNSIDGIGVEELFYLGTAVSDAERLEMAQEIAQEKVVLVADYVKSETAYNGSVQKCESNGFLYFPRENDNYEYKDIPDTIPHENANDVAQLSAAQNYLYLISDNGFSTKTSYLDALRETNYDVVLIDAFFKGTALTKSDVNSLKVKQNGAKRIVIAYMNIGSAEKYRYYWKDKWKLHHPNWLKKEYEGYEDEIWVKFWKKDWQDIIYSGDNSYTQRILDAGFDGAYLDNVEAFYFLYFD